ncbi:MAG: metalloprotease TldD [Chromatiales bacterium]|nr:metalloprotease TldD [Chromatiales bacterium]
MEQALDIAKQDLLAPAEIDEHHLQKVLSSLMVPGVDQAELYFQHGRREAWSLEDGIVKEGDFSLDRGVGVRAVSGEKTGFAYANEIVMPSLTAASQTVRYIARSGNVGALQSWKSDNIQKLYGSDDPLASMQAQDKTDLLYTIDAQARQADPRIKQVIASLLASYDVVLVVSSDGTWAADIRPLVRLNVAVVVADKDKRESGYAGAGGRFSYPELLATHKPEVIVGEAVRLALLNLEAVAAPAGEMVVVLGPGWPGVLLHEAIGHGLEGDFCRKGTSAFSNRIGERVATTEVTVVDDGTLSGRRGSLNIDDEGTATQCTTLIEKGILKTYMQDKTNARLMNTKPTGNGRRQSYAHLPMPRMTNTYMLNGQHSADEIIGSVDKGIYAVNFGGGQVDITSGKFVFSASEAYRIENGRVGAPLKGISLIGHGPDILTKVTMVGNDTKLDDGVGSCGKHGQLVPVGVGQPTLRVDGMTVGGTDI